MRGIILILLFSLVSFYSLAQDSRNPKEVKEVVEVNYTPQQLEAMRQAIREHPYTKYYDRLVVEYQDRMKANLKKYKVMTKEMAKPQYSDPSYFGHKRKPKKRPVGKRKYCKECEIVH